MINEIFKIGGLKALFVCLLLSPFWYLSIYLLNIDFFLNTDVTILMVISFVFTISACFPTMLANQFLDEENSFLAASCIATLYLWIWKVVLFLIAYSLIFFKDEKLYFYWYVIIYFIPIVVYFLYSFGKMVIKNSKKNQSHNT